MSVGHIYGERDGWVPQTIEDFFDGGAYPEINVPQFPFGSRKTSGKVMQLTGRTQEKPVKEKIEATRAALQAIIDEKLCFSKPPRSTTNLKYSSSSERIIRMVEAQKDPCEPPKFKINKKIPQGPPSPPAPVLHSPPRKLSTKELKDWKIPPCISNWKNPKGFTIALDKRLAADARGSQSTGINDKFAALAEALYIADRKAREGVEMRAQIEQKMLKKEREKKEENLKKLAQKAREERSGLKNINEGRSKDRHRETKNEYSYVEKHRDISEQIALNLAEPVSSNVSFDSRLMNGSKGISSGFGDEDDYTVYSKPWRSEKEGSKGMPRSHGSSDSTLIKFKLNEGANEDIFGIDRFLQEAKKSNKRKHE